MNYFGTDSPEKIKMLFEVGVDFPLVDDIVNTMNLVRDLDIKPVKTLFNDDVQ